MTERASETSELGPGPRRARDLRAVMPDEANTLETVELARFIALLESLPPDAWVLPVSGAPRNWDVKALVAHITGHYAAQSSLGQLRRLANPRTLRFYHIAGRSLLETVRQAQVGDRMFHTPDHLLTELRSAGDKALRNRSIAFRPLAYFSQPGDRTLRLPSAPLGPFAAVRDLWLHRFTVSMVTGRPFEVEPDHDDRIIDAIFLAAAQAAETALPELAVDLRIVGLSTEPVRFGGGDDPIAAITIEPEPFAQLAARRRSAAWAREHAVIDGNPRAATLALTAIAVTSEHRPY